MLHTPIALQQHVCVPVREGYFQMRR